jgi:hypothetical protein
MRSIGTEDLGVVTLFEDNLFRVANWNIDVDLFSFLGPYFLFERLAVVEIEFVGFFVKGVFGSKTIN